MMLEFIRKGKRSVGVIFIAIFVSILMIGFGVDYGSNSGGGAVIRVGDREFSYEEYYRHYSMRSSSYERAYGAHYRQKLIDELINTTLLDQLLVELGMDVGPEQVRESILKGPWFAGGFDPLLYKRLLKMLGLTSAAFESAQRTEQLRTQLKRLLSDVAFLSDVELENLYDFKHRKLKIRQLVVKSFDYERKLEKGNLDEAVLKDFFEERKENYRIGDKRRYAFVPYSSSDFLEEVELSEGDLRAVYREKEGSFYEPKKYGVDEIYVEDLSGIGPEPDGEFLEDVLGINPTGEDDADLPSRKELFDSLLASTLARLRDGEDFISLREELKAEGVELRRSSLGTHPLEGFKEEHRAAIKSLEPRDYSDTKSAGDAKAYTLFLREFKESRKRSFEEVKAELEAELRKLDAPEYARAAAYSFFDGWKRGTPLEDYAKSAGREIHKAAKALGRHQDPSGVPRGLSAGVFSMAGERDVVELGDSFYVVELIERLESRVPSLSEVRARVESDFRKEEGRRLAKEFAHSLLAELQKVPADKGSLSSLAKEKGIELAAAVELTWDKPAAAPFGKLASRKKAFTLHEAAPLLDEVLESRGNFYLVEFVELMQDKAEKDRSKGLADLRKEEVSASGERLFDSLVNSLKAKADVWYEPSLLE